MGTDRGLWTARLGIAVLAVGLGFVAFFLVAQASGSGRERAALQREGMAMDADIDRLRRANQAMRDEVRALESDPVYVESILRRWRRVGAGEKVVE
jgi:hypothetical protein